MTEYKEAHSESHLVESREYWWNPDYLALLAERLDLKACQKIADIGCGLGLLAFQLSPFLPSGARVVGVDSEKKYVKRAIQKAKKVHKQNGVHFDFLTGDANQIPLETGSQDLVACQTLLMHMKDPVAVVKEMKRCARKEGLVMAIEPNNLASVLMFDTYAQTQYEVDDMLELMEIRLRCEQGKVKLGEGFSSIGDALPDVFRQADLKDIQIYISDKSQNLIPPYDTREKRMRAAQMIDWIENQTGGFGYDHNWRYYQAGGGGRKTFDAYWDRVSRYQRQLLSDLKNQECFLSGGNLMYIVVGTA